MNARLYLKTSLVVLTLQSLRFACALSGKVTHVFKHESGSGPLGEFTDTSTVAIVYQDKTALTYRHSNALFGIPPYGDGVSGYMYQPTAPNNLGCNDLSTEIYLKRNIALLRRGNCSFTRKVKNAQSAGALGVIVIDDRGVCPSGDGSYPGTLTCGSWSPACSGCPYTENSPSTCQCALKYMADDGDGQSVTIPSFIVTNDDGETMSGRAAPPGIFDRRSNGFASLKWDLTPTDGRVAWQMWTHANDSPAAKFRVGFAPYLPLLEGKINFEPRYFVWDGAGAGCDRISNCSTQCLSGGLYCSIDPDGDLNQGISGADVVQEDLRQLCVFNVVNSSSPSNFAWLWWQHADYFENNCNTPSSWNQECSEQGMQQLGIDVNAVRACVSNSFNKSATGDPLAFNKILDLQLRLRDEMNIVALPTIVVQDVILRGGVTPQAALTAICAGYVFGTEPAVCKCTSVDPSNAASCVGIGGGGDSSLPGWGKGIIALVTIGIVVTVGAVYYLRRRTVSEVESLVEEYRSLSNDTVEGSGGSAVARPAAAPVARSAIAERLSALVATIISPPPSGAAPVPTSSDAY